MLLKESEASRGKISEELSTTLGANDKLGLKVDDTLFDIRLDAETLTRLIEKSAFDRKLLEVPSIWLVDSDWLCKNSKDDTPRLTECKSLERTLVEEDTLKRSDWDWL